MDVRINNGDMVLRDTGEPVYIDGIEEVFQQVLLCISVKKGGFEYDKELGCCAVTDVSGERQVRILEARLREAILPIKGAEIFVNYAWELVDGSIRTEITVKYNDKEKTGEVILKW